MSTPKDVLLIAPTWSPKIRHKIPGTTIDSWINDWTQWVANISTLNLVPVFFLHPNMEEAFAESNITPSIPVIRGNQVQEFLARAAVVVTDRSSIVNEGHFIGVPGVLVAPESDPLSFKLRDKYLDSGFILVDDFAELPSAVKHAVADDVTRFRQPADLPPEPSCEKLVSLILETRFE
ncbi:hypothetical protein GCM10007359_18020 [Rothia aerolata]|uniref:Uncharacterized protein n=2 Tax=Rothia aerolata TaxID=1812262 RepID=A0A917IW94_9MICC|nr:hypothetical protein GCM10007359_18020 [Rothia aerolata]